MGRCSPPVEAEFKGIITDPLVDGYGNDANGRLNAAPLQVRFAYANGSPGGAATVQQSIDQTHRVEICWAHHADGFACPGWDPGGEKWVVFDEAKGIGAKPQAVHVKKTQGENAEWHMLAIHAVPLDWAARPRRTGFCSSS
jgi:hypothetical protein